MLDIDIKVSGVKEVEQRLKNAHRKILINRDNALNKSGSIILRDAKLNAPRKTGNLQSSLTFYTGRDYTEVYVPSSSAAGSYALVVEKGSRYMKGRLFLRHAFDDNRTEIEGKFNNIFRGV